MGCRLLADTRRGNLLPDGSVSRCRPRRTAELREVRLAAGGPESTAPGGSEATAAAAGPGSSSPEATAAALGAPNRRSNGGRDHVKEAEIRPASIATRPGQWRGAWRGRREA